MSPARAFLLAAGLGLLLLPGAPAAQVQQEVASAPGAVLRGLDKVSGTTSDLRVETGGSATFGRLTITLTDCRYPVENPAADAFAFVTIHDALVPEGAVFEGWMNAASPALNALDHARFDIWLLRCTTS